jgi:heme oxygenase
MTEGLPKAPSGPVRAEGASQHSASARKKPVIGSAHLALRAATRNDHALIDRMMLPFDLKRPEDYRAFLTIHFEALLALRGNWRPQDSEDFERMIRCLDTDLQTLGTLRNPMPIPACIPSSPGAGLGIAYVIRGSRLGAAVLRRGVAKALSTSYLDFVPTLSWTEFLGQLEFEANEPNGTSEAILAARSTFSVFVTEFNRVNAVTAGARL